MTGFPPLAARGWRAGCGQDLWAQLAVFRRGSAATHWRAFYRLDADAPRASISGFAGGFITAVLFGTLC